MSQVSANINPFTDIDYGAGIRKLFGDSSANVLPGYNNVNSKTVANANVLYGDKTPSVSTGGWGGSSLAGIAGAFTGGSGSEPTGTGDAGGSILGATYSAPRYSAADLAGLNQSESLLNNSLGRVDNQLQIALDNIGRQFSTSENELQSGWNSNRQSYDTSSTQNQQNLRTNKNTIADQASSGLRGLLRLLGAYGAVGSDLGLAGNAVADQASQQRAGANQTFAQNQQSLDTNWGNFSSQFENEKRKLSDWRSNQENSARQGSLTNKQSLLQQLADVRRQRSSLLGGGDVDAQGFLNQANALSAEIDNLGRINPSYNGVTPTYTAAPLSSYQNTGNTRVTTDGGQAAGGMTPYLSMILGNNKNKKTTF